MRVAFWILLGCIGGYVLGVVVRPPAEPPQIPVSDVVSNRQPPPVLLTRTEAAPLHSPSGSDAASDTARQEGQEEGQSSSLGGTSEERWGAYHRAMQQLVEAERALLPQDHRKDLPATPEEIEAKGRWRSLLTSRRELKDADVARYMEWRATRATSTLAASVPALTDWAKQVVAEKYSRLFEEEGRIFLRERPNWENLRLPEEERNYAVQQYLHAYRNRLTALNSWVGGFVAEQVPEARGTTKALPSP